MYLLLFEQVGVIFTRCLGLLFECGGKSMRTLRSLLVVHGIVNARLNKPVNCQHKSGKVVSDSLTCNVDLIVFPMDIRVPFLKPRFAKDHVVVSKLGNSQRESFNMSPYMQRNSASFFIAYA